MRIVQINTTYGKGSTGNICINISKVLSDNQIENYIFYTAGKSENNAAVKYAGDSDIKLASAFSHFSGKYGFVSKNMTKKLIAKLDEIKPDIVHIHNIHSHNCNLQILFNYLSANKIKVLWTFHDCWAFTGYCTHFIMSDCNKWKSGCGSCPQFRHYSLFFDRSDYLYNKKRELLSSVDLSVVTPSQWLADVVKDSFLGGCPVSVINNGIDLSLFKPLKSDFREKHGIPRDKIIILGAAYNWNERKGIDVFQELSKRLDESVYQIVIIGLSGNQSAAFPGNVIALPLLSDRSELARIYSAADVFINPTREDTFPTVNMEAIACGTPVITTDVGGCPETVGADSGIVVSGGDIDGIINALERIVNSESYSSAACRDYACEHFDEHKTYQKYLSLYRVM